MSAVQTKSKLIFFCIPVLHVLVKFHKSKLLPKHTLRDWSQHIYHALGFTWKNYLSQLFQVNPNTLPKVKQLQLNWISKLKLIFLHFEDKWLFKLSPFRFLKASNLLKNQKCYKSWNNTNSSRDYSICIRWKGVNYRWLIELAILD